MLYKKNTEKTLSDELFQNPTSEYRGTPFWAWNCKLREDELLWQIDRLKDMGFGGFHMHVRSGMSTTYLSDEHMHLVKSCVEKAKSEHMLAWLYDEDRWPSGSAGGYVTKDRRYAEKYVLFTPNRVENTLSKEEAYPIGATYFLAAYDITLTPDGALQEYKRISEDACAAGEKWYAYVITTDPRGWFNNESYADTLSKEAIDKFIEITYETYNRNVSDDFGEAIPAMFTDEPQFFTKSVLAYAKEKKDITLPWTNDFDLYYKDHCGLDLLEHFPELVWDLQNGQPSPIRYHYHDLICERFTEAFADNCGAWCENHGIHLTGHMMEEPTLHSQTSAIGEAMRAYRSFGLPGIDMLCNRVELSTAKQAQSASHQFGREGVLSELYGVTNWDFDFRGHKFQGDWQAALGVTVRVPHLSWVSMKGSAKRDYPASIHYQSPWYQEYSYIENHYARLATVMTRGRADVRVGVIHPIESYWISFGPSDATEQTRTQLEQNFTNIIEWLLFGTIDFDFISESLLPSQCGEISDTLPVGEMNYSVVLVPGCLTLRSSTLKILKEFQEKGGRVIFIGSCPRYLDALPDERIERFYNQCEKTDFNQVQILECLKSERFVEIKNDDGHASNNLIYQLRDDGDTKWLMIAHAKKPAINDNVNPQHTRITLFGEYKPILYNTLTGSIEKISYMQENGKTILNHTFYSEDSLLLKLTPSHSALEIPAAEEVKISESRILKPLSYTLEEDNVYLLDMAEYSMDGGKSFEPLEELSKIDLKIRKQYHYPLADGIDVQPWVIPPEKIEHYPILRFTVKSEISASCKLAYEEAEEVTLNGERVSVKADGFFTDHDIHTLTLPPLRPGTNILEIKAPIGKRISIENFFLLGKFGVHISGCEKRIVPLADTIGFGDITAQGLPFYGGNLRYHTKVTLPECKLRVRANYYRSAMIKVLLDGKEIGRIAFDPFATDPVCVSAGEHELTLIHYGNRYNSFGALHDCGDQRDWFGPEMWYSEGDQWSYEYQLKKTGILASPILECYEK